MNALRTLMLTERGQVRVDTAEQVNQLLDREETLRAVAPEHFVRLKRHQSTMAEGDWRARLERTAIAVTGQCECAACSGEAPAWSMIKDPTPSCPWTYTWVSRSGSNPTPSPLTFVIFLCRSIATTTVIGPIEPKLIHT